MSLRSVTLPVILTFTAFTGLAAQDAVEPWPWIDPEGTEPTTLLLMGDTNIQNRDDPGGAYVNVIPTLQEADLRFANLEGPFAGTSKDPRVPDIAHKDSWTHSEPGQVRGLVAAGIDAVGVANNVTYPWQALLRSLDVLDENGILHTGGGENETAAREPVVIERNGVTFGFLQFAATYWPYQHAASGDQPGIAIIDVETWYQAPYNLDKPGQPPIVMTQVNQESLKKMTDGISTLSDVADVVVVSYHWGVSGTTEPVEYQKVVGRAAIEAGADIVMGHGPHQLQPVEIWNGRPIFYSVGNFVFDWWKMKKTPDGLLIRASVQDAALTRVAIAPVWKDAENNVYLADPNEGIGHEVYRKLVVRSGGDEEAPLVIEGKEILVTGIGDATSSTY